MNQIEHLDAIIARCHELLEIASKRTPGRWKHNPGRRMAISVDSLHEDSVLHGDEFEISDCDALFTASAAGPFEAGLRSTIAAIKWIKLRLADYKPECNCRSCCVTNEIIAAWPLELLK